jgi:hypothetical protein
METGAGEPTVVLEAGLNNGAASWQRVMPLLARIPPELRHHPMKLSVILR